MLRAFLYCNICNQINDKVPQDVLLVWYQFCTTNFLDNLIPYLGAGNSAELDTDADMAAFFNTKSKSKSNKSKGSLLLVEAGQGWGLYFRQRRPNYRSKPVQEVVRTLTEPFSYIYSLKVAKTTECLTKHNPSSKNFPDLRWISDRLVFF